MRRHRRSVDGDLTDWLVVRNRISPSGSSTKPVLCDSLQELALEVVFRVATGFHERPVYRDLFPRGLTALDALCDVVPAIDPDPSHSTARREVHALLEVLKLPIDDRGRRRAVRCANAAVGYWRYPGRTASVRPQVRAGRGFKRSNGGICRSLFGTEV